MENNKRKQLQARLAYCIEYPEDITFHTVSCEWYREWVDMDCTQETDVEIVEIEYTPDSCASPYYMTLEHFINTPLSQLVEEVAI